MVAFSPDSSFDFEPFILERTSFGKLDPERIVEHYTCQHRLLLLQRSEIDQMIAEMNEERTEARRDFLEQGEARRAGIHFQEWPRDLPNDYAGISDELLAAYEKLPLDDMPELRTDLTQAREQKERNK